MTAQSKDLIRKILSDLIRAVIDHMLNIQGFGRLAPTPTPIPIDRYMLNIQGFGRLARLLFPFPL